MADSEASLDIVIRTRAELEGAQSAEAQLDRDISKARELGREYAAQEGRGFQSPRTPESERSTPDAEEGNYQTTAPDAGSPDTSAGPDLVSMPQERDFPVPDVRAFEQQTQGIAAAGERMRAAFEQNGQMTLTLLNRTLELIEEQNRRLEDLDRELGQLAGRVKGLKNP
jgi:hypothetical protein